MAQRANWVSMLIALHEAVLFPTPSSYTHTHIRIIHLSEANPLAGVIIQHIHLYLMLLVLFESVTAIFLCVVSLALVNDICAALLWKWSYNIKKVCVCACCFATNLFITGPKKNMNI